MRRKHIFRIGIGVIFFITLLSPALYLIFGTVEKGRVKGIMFEDPVISLFPTSTYQKIEYQFQNKTYEIQGEENEFLLVGEEVKVIFFSNNPAKAKVFTFSNLFIDSIIQLPFCLLIWWALFKSFPYLFDPDRIPIDFHNILNIKREKENRIQKAHIITRLLIYSLLVITVSFLFYVLWIIYKKMTSGAITYQTGIGISIFVLIIIASIIHRVQKG